MRFVNFILLLTTMALFQCVPDKASGCQIDAPQSLSTLMSGESIRACNLVFSGFSYQGFDGAPAPNDILVTPISNSAELHGLRFDGSFSTNSENIAGISYSVVSNPSAQIVGATMSGDPFAETNSILWIQKNFDAPESGLTIWARSLRSRPNDTRSFNEAYSEIVVTTSLDFSSFSGGSTSLSMLSQSFVTIPEPSSLMLSASGIVVLIMRPKRLRVEG